MKRADPGASIWLSVDRSLRDPSRRHPSTPDNADADVNASHISNNANACPPLRGNQAYFTVVPLHEVRRRFFRISFSLEPEILGAPSKLHFLGRHDSAAALKVPSVFRLPKGEFHATSFF
jgi:hypothetical protein